MSRFLVVGGGYAAAILIALVTVWARNLSIDPAVALASSGMYAFGDAILFVAVFGLVSLVPTGAGLYFLKPYRRFWAVCSTIAITVGATGLAAMVTYIVGRTATAASPLAIWAAFSVLRILVAPLLALVFLLAALVSPYRSHRLALLAATFMEAVVTVYAAVTWFVPLFVDSLSR